jgi:superfamily II DNA/RNA helicase
LHNWRIELNSEIKDKADAIIETFGRLMDVLTAIRDELDGVQEAVIDLEETVYDVKENENG